MTNEAWFTVTLREWFESQRMEHTPHRAALIAAMEAGDTDVIRDLLKDAPFSNDQKRYLFDLLARWEHSRTGGARPHDVSDAEEHGAL